jgi:hypothetical protein
MTDSKMRKKVAGRRKSLITRKNADDEKNGKETILKREKNE